jgi:hypothetical protein
MALYLTVLNIFFLSQTGWPSVSSDRASWRNSLSIELVQTGAGRVWDRVQTNAPIPQNRC